MCFSAAASLVAGGAIGGVGAATLKKTRKKSEIPMASVPLIFAAQQFVEGFLWLSYRNPYWKTILTYAFMSFSHVLWPTFIPFATLSLESDRRRRKWMKVFLVIGVAVSLYLLCMLIILTPRLELVDRHFSYVLEPFPYLLLLRTLYVIATGPCLLLSSHKWIRIFGVLIMTSFAITYAINPSTYISVWCFFAALLSGIIFMHFRSQTAPSKAGFPMTKIVGR